MGKLKFALCLPSNYKTGLWLGDYIQTRIARIKNSNVGGVWKDHKQTKKHTIIHARRMVKIFDSQILSEKVM